ncbi:CAZyme family GT2 [Penicillium cf. griseofulvum]|nr:CAZyme family GT2 [Penicillium cf. griseofulvum]
MAFPFLRAFVTLFLYRYTRLVFNLFSFWTFKPIPPPQNPKLTSQDVTVIIPSLEGCGAELVETIRTILENQPFELLLVTIEANRMKAEQMLKTMPASESRIRLFTVEHPNKRRQMTQAIPEVRTAITLLADDDVSWPRTLLPWILAPFEKDEKYGGVVTCQRLRRAIAPSLSQRVWGFLGALYLERRNFDCGATTHVDGGLPCMSGRTVAYRTQILQNEAFTYAFTNEEWWFGKYQLNADDDNFITRWMVSHGWETYMQYHPRGRGADYSRGQPSFLEAMRPLALRTWCDPTLGKETELTNFYSRQPWSAYAVHLTTLSPPAFLGDILLVWLCHKATGSWGESYHDQSMNMLYIWIFTSKWIKLLGHYLRYPVDILLIPISVLFGYFHGAIKMYAVMTLNVTTWGSRDGADDYDAERMKKRTDADRMKQPYYPQYLIK